MRAKKLIEEKQERMNRLVDQGYFPQAKADHYVRQYAKIISQYYEG